MKKLVGYLSQNLFVFWKTLSRTELVGILLIILAGVRLYFVTRVDFPLNDGGMYYPIFADIINAHFFLPKVISYNHLAIPFAYPPLAFYIGAGLWYFLHIDRLLVLQYVPVLVSIVLMLPYFFFVSLLTKSFRLSFLSLLFFGLTPRSFEWIIMGGGLTRSFGFLFSLITLYFGYCWVVTGKKKMWGIVFLALTMLSHGEWTVFTLYSFFPLMLFRASNRAQAVVRFLFMCLAALILVSPWWITVVTWHGLTPYWAALHTRSPSVSYLVQFFSLYNFADEPLMPITMFCALLGLLVVLIRRDYLLPFWVVLLFLFSSLSRGMFASIVLPMLAAYGTSEIILAGANRLTRSQYTTLIICSFIALYLWINMQLGFGVGLLPLRAVDISEREAMVWVSTHTPNNSQFLVLSPETEIWVDRVGEWFPALSDRKSILTLQGTEWVPGFAKREKQYYALQTCEGKNLSCVEWFLRRNHLSLTHLYVSKLRTINQYGCCQLLYDQLKASRGYTLLYENRLASVWVRNTH